jgi:hypothetical protein
MRRALTSVDLHDIRVIGVGWNARSLADAQSGAELMVPG